MNDEFEACATKYQLNLIYLLDTSGSMLGEKINQLNRSMVEALQDAEETALNNEIQLSMRVVEFNTDARWIVGDQQHGVSHIDWEDLKVSGGTNTADAIDLARSIMHRNILGERNLKPVVILITDGKSNEPQKTLDAIERLKSALKSSTNPNKDKILRIAIAVENANMQELEAFASEGIIEDTDGTRSEKKPLVFTVDNVESMKGLIKAITVSSIYSTLASGVDGNSGDDTPVISPLNDDNDGWED